MATHVRWFHNLESSAYGQGRMQPSPSCSGHARGLGTSYTYQRKAHITQCIYLGFCSFWRKLEKKKKKKEKGGEEKQRQKRKEKGYKGKKKTTKREREESPPSQSWQGPYQPSNPRLANILFKGSDSEYLWFRGPYGL